MAKKLLLVLNNGELPFYLKDLCEVLMTLNEYRLYRFHITSERNNPEIFTPLLQPKNHPLSTTTVDTFLPEMTVAEMDTAPDLMINLTDLSYPDVPLKQRSFITPDFLSDLSGTYSTALVRALLQHERTLTCRIYLTTASALHPSLATGTFIVLPYSYTTTLDLIIKGVHQLILTSIARINSGSPFDSPSAYATLNQVTRTEQLKVAREIKRAQHHHRIEQIFFTNTWNIGIIDAPIQEVALSPDKKWEVKWFPEASGAAFTADPFGIPEEGQPVLFYEHFNGRKGELFIQHNGTISRKLLDSDVHMSYPYILEHQGSIYCLPEQQASGKLLLYKYDSANKILEAVDSLLEGFHAVDPSIVFHQGKWWLFCTNAAHKGADIRLFIFHSEELRGQWTPHLLNPVKTDIRSARPGGHFFRHNDQLYRPSQDSSNGYGAALVINRIDQLTPEHFSETEVNRLLPEQLSGIYHKGWHTISSCGNSTLVDGKRKKINLRNLLKIFRKKPHAFL